MSKSKTAIDLVSERLRDHISAFMRLDTECRQHIVELGDICKCVLRDGGTIYLMGNGGSAADCQHIAAELVGRFKRERKALPSVALTTDSSILTAIGNDYGFDEIFNRQVKALVRPGDLVIGISTSGGSANVLKALKTASEMGARTAGLTGMHRESMGAYCDFVIAAPSNVTAHIQEMHIAIGHIICEIIEEEMEP